MTIWNAENPFQYAEIRGDVVEVRDEDAAAAHIQTMSRKYFGGEYPQPRGRALLVIAPARQSLARPPGAQPQ